METSLLEEPALPWLLPNQTTSSFATASLPAAQCPSGASECFGDVFTAYVCTPDGLACTSSWEESAPLVEVSAAGESSFRNITDNFANVLAYAGRRATASSHSTWARFSLRSCASVANKRFFLDDKLATRDLGACHERDGLGQYQFVPEVLLTSYFNVRFLPPELAGSITKKGPFPADKGLLVISSFVDGEQSPALPCSSEFVSTCSVENTNLLIGLVRREMQKCRDMVVAGVYDSQHVLHNGTSNDGVSNALDCMQLLFQEITYGNKYHFGKGQPGVYYSYVLDANTRKFVAHGVNDALRGQIIDTAAPAAAGILDEGIRYGEFGGTSWYPWLTSRCQLLSLVEDDPSCRFLKIAEVFSFNLTQEISFVSGVGFNFRKEETMLIDSYRPSSTSTREDEVKEICDANYAVPCAPIESQNTVTYTITAFQIYPIAEVLADITDPNSTVYEVSNFYVFAIDAEDGTFVGHGANPSLVENKVQIDKLADAVGLSKEQLDGSVLLQDLRNTASYDGGGFVAYNWTGQNGKVDKKITFARMYHDDVSGRNIIVGSGYLYNMLPDKQHESGWQCDDNLIQPCSRRRKISAVGMLQTRLLLANLKGPDEINAEIELTIRMARINVPHGNRTYASAASLFLANGTLVVSSETRYTNPNELWQDAYAGMTFSEIMLAEEHGVDSNELFAQIVLKSSNGGGWIKENEFDIGLDDVPRIWLVSSPVCSKAFGSGAMACAYIVAQQLEKGCEEGSELTNGVCVPCEPGSYLSKRLGKCTPCPIGSFSNRHGRADCTSCRELPDAQYRYMDVPNSIECKQCPEGTHRKITSPGENISECVCLSGYYQNELKAHGVECVPCPDGAVCHGANADLTLNEAPYPQPGFYGMEGYTSRYKECENGKSQCKGGRQHECADGYEGIMCQACSKDYYLADGECHVCKGKLQPLYTFLATLGIVVLWFGLNTLPHEALYVTLEFMQTSDQIGNFGFEWGSLLAPWLTLSTFVNFDVDIIVMWQCHIPWSYSRRVGLLLSLPLVKVLLLSIAYVIKYFVYHRLVRTRVMSKQFLEYIFGDLDLKYIEETPSRLIFEVLSFHHIMYLALCERTFAAFVMDVAPDGSMFMTDAPNIAKGSATHNYLYGFSIFFLFFYVIGIPLFQAYILFNGKRKNLLADPKYLIKYGFLYTRYNARFFYWELVVQIRRIVFVSINYFAWNLPMMQAACGLVASGFFLALQFSAGPFRHSYINTIDSMACTVNMAYIIVGLVDSYASDPLQRLIFEVMMNSCFVGIMAFSALILILEDFDMSAQIRASKMAALRFRSLVLTECLPDGDETVDEMEKRTDRILTTCRLAFRILDRDESGILEIEDFVENFSYLRFGKGLGESGVEGDLSLAQGQALTAIMSRYIDQNGKPIVLESDFLHQVVSELCSRSVTEIGKGTGIRRLLRERGFADSGITDTFVTDAIDQLALRLGFQGTVMQASVVDDLKRRLAKMGTRGSPDAVGIKSEFVNKVLSRLKSRDSKSRNGRDSPGAGDAEGNSDDSLRKVVADQYNIDVQKLDPLLNLDLMTSEILQELTNTLDPHGLVGTFHKGLNTEETMRVIRLERLMRTALSDAGPVSHFRHDSYSSIMRTLVDATPTILTFLCDIGTCSQDDADCIHRLTRFLAKQYDTYGTNLSPFVSMVDSLDHAPLVTWMMTASESDRDNVNWLIDSIHHNRRLSARVDDKTLDASSLGAAKSKSSFGLNIREAILDMADMMNGRVDDEMNEKRLQLVSKMKAVMAFQSQMQSRLPTNSVLPTYELPRVESSSNVGEIPVKTLEEGAAAAAAAAVSPMPELPQLKKVASEIAVESYREGVSSSREASVSPMPELPGVKYQGEYKNQG